PLLDALPLPAVYPAAFLPFLIPALLKTVDEIGAVRIETDPARLLQAAKRFDGRRQLHPVVGGPPLPAGYLLDPAAVHQNRRPPSGAGVAGTGAVGVNGHFFHSRAPLTVWTMCAGG